MTMKPTQVNAFKAVNKYLLLLQDDAFRKSHVKHQMNKMKVPPHKMWSFKRDLTALKRIEITSDGIIILNGDPLTVEDYLEAKKISKNNKAGRKAKAGKIVQRPKGLLKKHEAIHLLDSGSAIVPEDYIEVQTVKGSSKAVSNFFKKDGR